MVEKIKSVLRWIHLTFLSSSVKQIRYVPIKVPYAALQKAFFNFFEVGGKVKGYDFSASKEHFYIHENVYTDSIPWLSNESQLEALISYKVSQTDNDYLIKLEVALRYGNRDHLLIQFIKWLLFVLSMLLFIVGLGFLFFSTFESQHYPLLIIPTIVFIILSGFSVNSSYKIKRANTRFIAAIRSIESSRSLKRF